MDGVGLKSENIYEFLVDLVARGRLIGDWLWSKDEKRVTGSTVTTGPVISMIIIIEVGGLGSD